MQSSPTSSGNVWGWHPFQPGFEPQDSPSNSKFLDVISTPYYLIITTYYYSFDYYLVVVSYYYIFYNTLLQILLLITTM